MTIIVAPKCNTSTYYLKGSISRWSHPTKWQSYINGVKSDLSIDQAALSVIGTLPLAGGFNVFARYGRTKIDSKVSAGNVKPYESGDGAVFGAGVGYAFTPNVAVRIEYLSPAKDLRNLSAGVSCKF